MSLLVIIQARLSSLRLPNKINADIAGASMLGRVVERASKLGPFTVAYPPPELKEEDVLGRFARIARKNPEVDTFVRLTADCPLLDVGVGGFVINLYRERQSHIDFVGTAPEMDGLDCEVFSRSALMMADLNAHGAYDREHLTHWMRRNLGAMIVNMAPSPLRWSVDDESGLDFVRQVYRSCDLCARAVPHHTNSVSGIGGGDRILCVDLHQVEDGGLTECAAADIKGKRMGGAVYVSKR
jgi:spore coat polysaccharide biosynthesis protein SpsF (cytidylyltransferase family)